MKTQKTVKKITESPTRGTQKTFGTELAKDKNTDRMFQLTSANKKGMTKLMNRTKPI